MFKCCAGRSREHEVDISLNSGTMVNSPNGTIGMPPPMPPPTFDQAHAASLQQMPLAAGSGAAGGIAAVQDLPQERMHHGSTAEERMHHQAELEAEQAELAMALSLSEAANLSSPPLAAGGWRDDDGAMRQALSNSRADVSGATSGGGVGGGGTLIELDGPADEMARALEESHRFEELRKQSQNLSEESQMQAAIETSRGDRGHQAFDALSVLTAVPAKQAKSRAKSSMQLGSDNDEGVEVIDKCSKYISKVLQPNSFRTNDS